MSKTDKPKSEDTSSLPSKGNYSQRILDIVKEATEDIDRQVKQLQKTFNDLPPIILSQLQSVPLESKDILIGIVAAMEPQANGKSGKRKRRSKEHQKPEGEILSFLGNDKDKAKSTEEVSKFCGDDTQPTGKRLNELEKAGKVKSFKVKGQGNTKYWFALKS